MIRARNVRQMDWRGKARQMDGRNVGKGKERNKLHLHFTTNYEIKKIKFASHAGVVCDSNLLYQALPFIVF